jgi:hypothetical protein
MHMVQAEPEEARRLQECGIPLPVPENPRPLQWETSHGFPRRLVVGLTAFFVAAVANALLFVGMLATP